jgi:hypothetical protein
MAPSAGACTESDLQKLSQAIASGNLDTKAAFAAALGPTCEACAVSSVGQSEWRAVVLGHEGYVGNVGGCAMRLGASAACGQAIDELSTCLIIGCAGCGDRRAQDTCADALTTTTGPCAAPLRTTRTKCPAAALVNAFDTSGACQSLVGTVRLFCGPPPDGG